MGPRWWLALTAGLAVVLLLSAVLGGGTISEVAFLLGMVTVSAVAWSGVRRRRLHRQAAVCLATGISLFGFADVVRQVVALPGFSAVDLIYLAAYLSIAVGIRLLLTGESGTGRSRGGLVDAAVAFVVLAYLEWELVLGAGAGGQAPHTAPAIWALHTMLDACIVAGSVRLWLARPALRQLAGWMGLTASVWFAVDLTYLRSGATVPAWIFAAWLLADACLAVVIRALPRVAATPVHQEQAKVTLPRMAFVLTPVLIPPSFELAAYVSGRDISPVPGILATVALLGLVFTRAAYLLRDREAFRRRLHSQARFFSALAANSSDAVVLLDADGRFLPGPEEPQQQDLQLMPLLRGGDGLRTALVQNHAETRALVARARRVPGVVVTGQLSSRDESGRPTWFSVRVVDLLDDPDVAAVLVTGDDVTARTVAEQELMHRSLYDELTGLANRALFDDRVALALRRRERSGTAPAVLSIDLDGFRDVNESLGYDYADRLLCAVADRLRAVVRSEDTVARLGADEFGVLIEGGGSPLAEAETVSARVQEALAEPFALDGHQVAVSAGFGLAVADLDVADLDAAAAMVLRDADIALHRAKAAGRGRMVVFDPEMRATELHRVRLEADLAQALERGELHLVFQPVVDLATERLIGFEALLRWTHPTLGPVPPDAFIPVAEATGLIRELGHWVLEQACHTAAAWQRTYPQAQPLAISVNVSGRQLADADLGRFVADVLADSGLPPCSLVLELTETALVDDPARAAADLGRLRALGVRLAVDDFGTGYSSLAYLGQFPVDILKIDRSFVAAITDIEHRSPLVRGMLELARNLGLETVAEGVESAVQRDRLRAEGCDRAQGYLFSRPLDSTEAELQLVNLTGRRRRSTGRTGTGLDSRAR
ncbi:bifunctional diguanylate cyclase/phosphodiesterase [Geodermatophilus ruber]|uniref:bifunctional diguanylate cyclase/phosphodiesterase n=1 Tax=Geodermatophilus ruber TaxID=504800 RepID=UPI0015A6445B|nr:bifunctional diguanylate cyclase/phosphodiesterase [Geodermatophilus ruber]